MGDAPLRGFFVSSLNELLGWLKCWQVERVEEEEAARSRAELPRSFAPVSRARSGGATMLMRLETFTHNLL
jgi:hypothetical protein